MAKANPKSHHRSDDDSQFSVVLFNTDSSDKGVKAKDRQQCIKKVMDSVLSQNYPDPLFVLCQDKVSPKKHQILCEKLQQDPNSVRCIPEAVVYYHCKPEQKDIIVNYVDILTLQQIDGRIKLDAGNDFTVARLMACVLQSRGRPRTLLVSWHGPHKELKLDKKSRCFNRLVIFCERLRDYMSCGIVILGGDFNFPAAEARNNLAMLGQSGLVETGAVCDNYKTTSDRKNLKMLDYIVCWPANKFQTISTDVIERNFRREKGTRPFDHPIVSYKFGCRSKKQSRKVSSIHPPGTGISVKSEE